MTSSHVAISSGISEEAENLSLLKIITQLALLQLIYFKTLYKPNKALCLQAMGLAHGLFGLIGNILMELVEIHLMNLFSDYETGSGTEVQRNIFHGSFLLSAQAAVEAMTDNLRKAFEEEAAPGAQ